MTPQSASQNDIIFVQVNRSLVKKTGVLEVLQLIWKCSTDLADESISLFQCPPITAVIAFQNENLLKALCLSMYEIAVDFAARIANVAKKAQIWSCGRELEALALATELKVDVGQELHDISCRMHMKAGNGVCASLQVKSLACSLNMHASAEGDGN